MSEALARRESLAVVTNEPKLLAACDRALAALHETQDVAVKATIVRDLNAIKAVAKAYRMSTEAQRRAAEIAVICLRSFGESIAEQYADKTQREIAALTGIDINTVSAACVLAQYSEADLDKAFLKIDGPTLSPHTVIWLIRKADPAYLEQRRREIEQNKRERAYGLLMRVTIEAPVTVKGCEQAASRIDTLIAVGDDEQIDAKQGEADCYVWKKHEREFFVELKAKLLARAELIREYGDALAPMNERAHRRESA